MDHREQTPEQERLTTLALEIQQHCFDYFDGKLTPKEWLTLVVDAMQQHQAESRPEPEVYASVTYYPETDMTVAIGPETPYDPAHWPQHLHADDCQCPLCAERHEAEVQA